MTCTKRARIKVSTSGGTSKSLCYRHSFMFVRQQIQMLQQHDFGVYVQRLNEAQTPPHTIHPDARHAVTTPDDREGKKKIMAELERRNREQIFV